MAGSVQSRRSDYAIVHRRGGLGKYNRRMSIEPISEAKDAKRRGLPEYLEANEVNAIIAAGEHERARLLMLMQWRAGLRVGEALALRPTDVSLNGEYPALNVRNGKGGKQRLVPIHSELSLALRNVMQFAPMDGGPIVKAARNTAWLWVQHAYDRVVLAGLLAPDRKIGTHTLRHSAARHWLANGIQINKVQLWLGHSRMETTLIYLKILPDLGNDMARVP